MADVDGVRLNHCLYSSEVNTLGDEGMRPSEQRKNGEIQCKWRSEKIDCGLIQRTNKREHWKQEKNQLKRKLNRTDITQTYQKRTLTVRNKLFIYPMMCFYGNWSNLICLICVIFIICCNMTHVQPTWQISATANNIPNWK